MKRITEFGGYVLSHGKIINVRFDELIERVNKLESLKHVRKHYGISSQALFALLEGAGFDTDRFIVQQHESGETARALKKRHGISYKRLRSILTSNGVVLNEGNHIRDISDEQIRSTVTETDSISAAAKKLGLDRATVKKRVQDDNIPIVESSEKIQRSSACSTLCDGAHDAHNDNVEPDPGSHE